MYDNLADGKYTWTWFKVGDVWGANDTAMHVVIMPDPEGDNNAPSTLAEGLHAHEEAVVKAGTELCSPKNGDKHIAWRVGDAAMVAGRCYDVKLDLAADQMQLSLIFAAQNGVNDYIVMTEHLPREFAAGDALTRVPGGARVPATETALIKGRGTVYDPPNKKGGFIPGGAMVQDGVAVAALIFALLALALGVMALCVACKNGGRAQKAHMQELGVTMGHGRA